MGYDSNKTFGPPKDMNELTGDNSCDINMRNVQNHRP